MAFDSLREWIQSLESDGDLKRIKAEVDWDRELGTLTRIVFSRGGPALLFENIKGYKTTRSTKLFTGGLATYDRVALTLGYERGTSTKELVVATMRKLQAPLAPISVKTGPVKENVLKGDDIDLYQFPAPKWHHRDGGRYINTSCGVVTRDPDTGILNVGMYRGMILARDKISMQILAAQHIGQHFTKYRERGELMPVAVVQGWDPVLDYVAAMPVPPTICEYDVMGSMRGKPVELLKCETCDLEVPASAELVFEGFVSVDPATYELEGPFGEYTGHYCGQRRPKPVMKVTCITHRDDPILRGTLEGTLPGMLNENSVTSSIQRAAIAWNILITQGVPGVLDVCVHPVTTGTNVVVQIHKTYRGQAKQVAAALWGSSASQQRYKNVMVVDEDIDIHSYEALDWAFAYRVNAAENDIIVFPGMIGSPLDPSTRFEDNDFMKYGTGKWNRVLIDATINWDYEKQAEWGGNRYPPDVRPLLEDIELVEKKWHEYGL